MAKRIIIQGSNLLTSLSDDWGGVNNTGAEITIHNTAIPDGAEWAINKGEVERFIKAQYGIKFGDFRTTDPDEHNFVHLLCFATTEDASAYDSDPTQTGLIIKDLTIPISTATVDSYVATLVTSRSTTTQYLVKDGGSFEIPLRFNATHIIAATSTQEAMSGNGVLYVERSQNGTSWTQIMKQNIAASTENTGYSTSVDPKGLLIEGTSNYIRLRTTYSFVDGDGNERTIASTPIILNITSVTLRVEATTAWQEPQIDPSALSLAYTVRGTVQRTLHLSVTGSVGTYTTSQAITAAQTSATFSLVEMSAYGLLTHGIKTCEAWLTAGDETVGELESDHLIIRIMVARTSAADALEPRLLISEMKEQVENFVQTRLLAYAIYSPVINSENQLVNNGDAIPTTFTLTNSASSIITASQTKYSSVLVTPSPGYKYYLDMTVEIEQNGDTLSSFLHATREVNNTAVDFLLASIGTGAIYLPIDNTGGFQPTTGSTFLLNPKQRNNDEDNPFTILNAKDNNAEVASTWEGFKGGTEDAYIKDGSGESCLRVNAGQQLSILMNPWAALYRSPNISMNVEFDVCIRNVTNEDDPIIRIAEQVGGVWRGLRMLPMVGYMTTETWNADEESDFRWQEDERVHIAINIVNAVYPNSHNDGLCTAEKATIAAGSMSLVRIFINGIINREFTYTPSAEEFCTGTLSNGGIIIGQSGADIDIYSIRIWEGVSLTPENVLQDYISTLSDSSKKRKIKAENAIIDPNTGLIGLDYISGEGAVTGIKKNWLIWHGNEPYHENAHKNETGWLEWARYDENGEYMPEYSGKLCEETKSLPQKQQGTTAKTYYYHNIQWKSSDVEATIIVAISLLHSSITATWDGEYEWLDENDEPTGEVGAWKLKGGCLGKNFPLPSESAKPYHAADANHQSVVVPDGWIDGNGYYRGPCACVAPNTPLFQKSVNKINYASSMQSHIIGVNRLYNELHTAIVGKNTMQNAVSNAVVAKHLEPFLFFTQAEGASRAVFRGPCAWGAGKMDKPSWGYVKSAHPDFCMIEGADNDKPLTDMRVPFDDEQHKIGVDTAGNDIMEPAKVYYDPEEESWLYRLPNDQTEVCIDFDSGKTDDNDYPVASIVGYIKNAWNFLYLHAPRIRHYNGTLTQFTVDAELAQRSITSETSAEERAAIEAAQGRVNTANKYWCHAEGGSDTGDYLLKRYDFSNAEWVDAGLWNFTTNQYDQIDLRTYSMTASAWNALTEAQRAQDDIVADAFKSAVVADAKENIGSYFKVDSLKFHYAFENHFIAGTDNCSKNTYYVLDPSTHLFELHQDDVDTVLATDNSGLQSKPYYIDRMHPYGGVNSSRVAMTGDVDNASILYEGYYNVLFDLCELMYEDTRELQSMLNSILEHMASLSGGFSTDESDAMSGVWRGLNRYIFDVQRYFPATVFNEAARIRYEFPELIGFLSDVRSIHPIKQSLGDQLQAELQFMKRRLVYMASYAAFGDFTPTSLRNSLTGLSEATDSFGMQKFALPGSSSPSAYTFNLVPHQWIYPTGGRETSNLIDPHTRVAPGETFVFDINPGQASDLGINVFGLNYYRELGNVGDMVANNGAANFTLNGRRLTKFVCEPTMYYTEDQLPAFRVNNIIIGSATRLKEFSVNGAVVGTGTMNLSMLTVCETIDLRNTGITQVNVPKTSTLTTLHLPDNITTISLTAQPSLSTLTVGGYGSLSQITVTGCPLISMQSVIERAITESSPVTRVELDNMAWTQVTAQTIRWLLALTAENCLLKGSILMTSTQMLTFDETSELIRRYDDVRSESNDLYIYFSTSPIYANQTSITGNKYLNPSELVDGVWYGLGLQVLAGNNVAVAYLSDGSPIPDVTWTLEGDDNTSYATFGEGDDARDPALTVLQVAERTFTVRVTIGLTNGDTVSVTKSIGLWRRVPKVGDYAWIDGQFDEENDASKKLAGIVVRRYDITYDDTGNTDDANITSCKLDVWAGTNVTMPDSTDGESANVPTVNGQSFMTSWGLYPDATLGFTGGSSSDNYAGADSFIRQIYARMPETLRSRKSGAAASDPFDTANTNIGGSTLYINPETYQDATNVANGGYKELTYAMANDFNTESENEGLMEWSDALLEATLTEMGISHERLPQNPQELADVMQQIVAWAGAQVDGDGNSLNTNIARFRELLMPAVRLANCWCPADVQNPGFTESDIDEQYQRGKWMLPSEGLLMRIYNFYGNSLGKTVDGVLYNGVPYDVNANFYQGGGGRLLTGDDLEEIESRVNTEAQMPLFAILNKRGRAATPTNSNHWSSTEYGRANAWFVYFNNGNAYNIDKCNSIVVRPVAAFTFER